MASNTQGVLENLVDGYLADAGQIKGGYFVIDSLANVNTRSIIKGSYCYVTSENIMYVFEPDDSIAITDDTIKDKSNWKPATLGASFEYADHVLTIKVPIVS